MRSEEVIHSELMRIWNTMLECMYIGCHTSGSYLVDLMRRRAFDMHQNLIGLSNYSSPQTWLEEIRTTEVKFRQILNGLAALH
jgi:L-serine dehydratase